jgi:hypothetical protein
MESKLSLNIGFHNKLSMVFLSPARNIVAEYRGRYQLCVVALGGLAGCASV